MNVRTCQAVAALLVVCAALGSARDQAGRAGGDTPSVHEIRAIAEEGYIYGLPLVMNYAVMNSFAVNRDSGQFKAPFNQISSEARVFTSEDTAVIVPNSDTPYSMLSMDLRAEPLVLSVPAVEKGRYYSVQLCDGNTFNYGYIGSRATGNEPGDYLVAGPDWKGEKPAGVRQVFRSSTQFSLAVYRTQLLRPDDMANVQKVQAGYTVQTLSAYLKQPAPAAAAAVDFPKIDTGTRQEELLRVPRVRAAVRTSRARGDSHSRQAGQDRRRPRGGGHLPGALCRRPGCARRGHEGGRSQGGRSGQPDR